MIISCNIWNKEEKKATEKSIGKKAKDPVDVYVMSLQKQKIFSPLVFAGFVKSRKTSFIYAPISGLVSRILIKEGHKVRARGKLLSLQPDSQGLEFKHHVLTARNSGILASWDVKEGVHVSLNQKLGSVVDREKLEMTVFAALKDLASIRIGDILDVTVSPSTSWEMTLPGKVVKIASEANYETLSYPIVIEFDCQQSGGKCKNPITLGSLAKVLVKNNVRNSILVPSKILFKGSSKIILVDKNGKAKWKDVKTGQVIGDHSEISSGLQEGDIVVSSFSRRPQDGAVINIIKKEFQKNHLSDDVLSSSSSSSYGSEKAQAKKKNKT